MSRLGLFVHCSVHVEVLQWDESLPNESCQKSKKYYLQNLILDWVRLIRCNTQQLKIKKCVKA